MKIIAKPGAKLRFFWLLCSQEISGGCGFAPFSRLRDQMTEGVKVCARPRSEPPFVSLTADTFPQWGTALVGAAALPAKKRHRAERYRSLPNPVRNQSSFAYFSFKKSRVTVRRRARPASGRPSRYPRRRARRRHTGTTPTRLCPHWTCARISRPCGRCP